MTAPTVAIPASHFSYFWNILVLPRLGIAPYTFGGQFSSTVITQGTDCSGAVGTELSCLVYGPQGMDWDRGNNGDFSTFTFAGATPGQTGPFGGAPVTSGLICISSPAAAPSDYAMIIAVNQQSDAEDAHMICRVGGIDIEMGGNEFFGGIERDYHTSQTNPDSNTVFSSIFNQWLYLPGPLVNDIPTLTVPPYPGLVAAQFL
jgi:hypothetical protein